MALPAILFVPPPLKGARIEFASDRGPAALAAAASAFVHQEWTGRGLELSLEEMVALLHALVPYDLTALHGQPFAVKSIDGDGKEHRFATLVGAYAVASIALAASMSPPLAGQCLIAHLRQSLNGYEKRLQEAGASSLPPPPPTRRSIQRRPPPSLTNAGIIGGLFYLGMLERTLAVDEQARLAPTMPLQLLANAGRDYERLLQACCPSFPCSPFVSLVSCLPIFIGHVLEHPRGRARPSHRPPSGCEHQRRGTPQTAASLSPGQD